MPIIVAAHCKRLHLIVSILMTSFNVNYSHTRSVMSKETLLVHFIYWTLCILFSQ